MADTTSSNLEMESATNAPSTHSKQGTNPQLFRSENMLYVRLLMRDEIAYDTVRDVGRYGRLHVVDLSHGIDSGSSERQTRYKKRVGASNVYEKKLLAFYDAFQQYDIDIPAASDVSSSPSRQADQRDVLDWVRSTVDPLEEALTQNVLFRRAQKRQIVGELERLCVLQYLKRQAIGDNSAVDDDTPTTSTSATSPSYGSFDETNNNSDMKRPLLPAGADKQDALYPMRQELLKRQKQQQQKQRSKQSTRDLESGTSTYEHSTYQHGIHLTSTICGVIPVDKRYIFERMVFRLSRGNAIVSCEEIEEPIENPDTDELEKKVVFSGITMGTHLIHRIEKVAQHCGANVYDIDTSVSYQKQINSIQSRLNELRNVLSTTDIEIHHLLQNFAYNKLKRTSPWLELLTAVRQEVAICDVLRQCGTEGEHSSVLILEGWVPADDVSELQSSFQRTVQESKQRGAVLQLIPPSASVHGQKHAQAQPPTYLKLNDFTASFQGIVDTYGVPRYKEMNPGVFTIITFPFLFGVMYGDIGHGSILFIAALFMVLYQKQLQKGIDDGTMGEIPRMVFGGRYLLLLMGAFATYCGFIYNDCFSIPTNLFGSAYSFDSPHTHHHHHSRHSAHTASPASATRMSGYVYPFGIDPAWYHDTNSLAFFNSFKMKLSVTLGVTQMSFGLILSLSNHLYENDYTGIVLEFLPRIAFLTCTFGYMIFLCIYKMCIDWEHTKAAPPPLVQTMIAMFLSPGNVDKNMQLYPGQAMVQLVLLFTALGSVPVMLLGEPLITNMKWKKNFGGSKSESDTDNTQDDSNNDYHQIDMDEKKGLLNGHNKQHNFNGRNGHGHEESKQDEHDSYQNSASQSEDSTSKQRRNVTSSTLESDVAADHLAGKHDDSGDQRNTDLHGHPHHKHVTKGEEPEGASDGHEYSANDPHYNFSDHLITNSIHTIEFVLGAVSNTASYLRLWALSLAHAELSDVFWSRMIMQYGVNTGSPFMLVIGFAVWAMATFAVLLCMDVLECFLHALRLHWVEFQSKFYHADGVAYDPYKFESINPKTLKM